MLLHGILTYIIRCTISVTVMFIMLCNTVQATFNVSDVTAYIYCQLVHA